MSPARFFAPLAIIACAVAVFAIVKHNANSGSSSPQTGSVTTTSTTHKSSKSRKGKKRVYVVKPGDVLSQIAEKTHVPLDEIQRLNPNVDAQTLHAGQKIKLSP